MPENNNSVHCESEIELSVCNTQRDMDLYINNNGLKFERKFTSPDIHPYDEINWEKRVSVIKTEEGDVVNEQKSVEVPEFWSQLATDIIATKYFRRAGVPDIGSEVSAKQVFDRVAKTIRQTGEEFGGYFATSDDADTFEDELVYLLVNQMGAFNSPTFFNCGLYHAYGISDDGGNWYWDQETQRIEKADNNFEHPQVSACFIQSIEDDLMAIFDLVKQEAKIFKYGSGSGTNFSPLRAVGEKLSGGGTSSGLMSFLKVFDRAAGATKSGGTTRRAAKMVCLDIDHPEIVDFIEWKVKEEKKVKALVEAGYSSDFDGEAYQTVSGQNSNNSVRIPDEFMEAYLKDGEWSTTLRTTGEVHETFKAEELMQKLSEAAWTCADPGLQFHTNINKWHTCANSEQIVASNPCSEFLFVNDSACNLASINLVKFLKDDGTFDVDAFRHACRVFITAQEILVDLASYPTKKIARNSHDFRPLGLGFANLGGFLMRCGLPYDSDEGRAIASAISAIMTGTAYNTSAQIADAKGTFERFEENRDVMLKVMRQHRDAISNIKSDDCPVYLLEAAKREWDEVIENGERVGFRNAQATLVAPTGTIGLLMDCDTTGIEPDYSIVKFKKLTGGGSFKIVNQSVRRALETLGYSSEEVEDIINYAQGTSTLVGAPFINSVTLKAKGFTDEDLAEVENVLPGIYNLSSAFTVQVLGEEILNRIGIPEEQYSLPDFNLLENLGYTQNQVEQANSFICGKMTLEGAPHLKEEHLPVFDCAIPCGDSQRRIYPMGHVKMMAAVQPFISGAISKTVNLPNETTPEQIEKVFVDSWKLGLKSIAIYRDGSKLSQPLNAPEKTTEEKPVRRRLPDERKSITHKFSIAGHEGYLTVGLYEDGSPGELFLTMSKQGSVISGLMDTIATMTSILLQYGVPVEALVHKFSHMRFEPSGFTGNKDIPIAKSIIDYVFRWLGLKFLPEKEKVTAFESSTKELDNGMSGIEKAITTLEYSRESLSLKEREKLISEIQADAPPCHVCGAIMIRSGSCYKCVNCGSTSGCS